MPYKTTDQLPKSVKDNLPFHAQEIYKESFNNAWKQYKDPEKRDARSSREKTSHKVAWNSVKTTYVKNSEGKWVEK